MNEQNLPRFYYIHKPAGSPESAFPGVAPTGPLPDSVDFPMTPNAEPEVFKALFFGDTQPRDIEEVEYIAHDVVEPIVREGTDASFGVTLGDIAFDDLGTMEPLNRAIALIGIPWYNVIGNHDLNYEALDDEHSDETFERIYGPSYYAFDYGPAHFLVLDDVAWYRPEGEGRGRYTGGLGPEQMEFIRKRPGGDPRRPPRRPDDAHPARRRRGPPRALPADRGAPLHPLGLGAHALPGTHLHRRGGRLPRASGRTTTSSTSRSAGAGGRGAPDEQGIPHTTMRDGAPNGYSIFTFDGHDYAIEFRAARRPADHQMTIFAPEEVDAGRPPGPRSWSTSSAAPRSRPCEMRVGDGRDLGRPGAGRRPRPVLRGDEGARGGRDAPARPVAAGDHRLAAHLAGDACPTGLAAGTHAIEVRTTDQFGQTYEDRRIIRVR